MAILDFLFGSNSAFGGGGGGSWDTPQKSNFPSISLVPTPAYASSGGLASSAKNQPSSQANYNPYAGSYSPYTPPQTKQINNKSSAPSGSSGVGGLAQLDTTSMLNPNTDLGGGSPLDAINQSFNQFNDYLNSQESQANQNFSDVKSLYDTQKSNQESTLKQNQQTQTEGVKKNEATNLAQVRQLLSDLQQKNAARTAITGGGSTSDVLAERFGREAQSRLGNVQDQTTQALQRVNDFYNQSIQQLNDSYNSNIFQARQSLNDNLSQIQAQRNQSASAKQQGTIQAWQDYYNNVNQAKLQAAQFKAQYDTWAQQQNNALAATQGFNTQNASILNEGVSNSYSPLPTYGINQTSKPNINPYFNTNFSKKNQEDQPDPFANAYSSPYANAISK